MYEVPNIWGRWGSAPLDGRSRCRSTLDGRKGVGITITITITILYSACSQKVSRALRRRVYINIEQKKYVLR